MFINTVSLMNPTVKYNMTHQKFYRVTQNSIIHIINLKFISTWLWF